MPEPVPGGLRRAGRLRLGGDGLPWLLALPLVLLVACLVVPAVWVGTTAFEEGTGKFFDTITDSLFVEAVIRTVIMSAIITAICWLLAIVYSFALVAAGRALRIALLGVLFLTFWISLLVRTYGWVILFQPSGVLEDLLQGVGLIDGDLGLFQTTAGMYPGMVHIMVPYMVLPIYTALAAIPAQQLRASQALGAKPGLVLRRVLLPQLRSGSLAGIVLVFIISLGFYITPRFLGGPGSLTVSTLIDREFNEIFDFAAAAAMGIALLAVVLVLYIVADRLLKINAQWGAVETGGAGRGEAQHGEVRRALGRARFPFVAGAGLIAAYLLLPMAAIVPVSFTTSDFLTFPPEGFSLRWYEAIFTDPVWTDAFSTSLTITAVAALLATVSGTLAALAVDRARGPASGWLRAIFIGPIVLPYVVYGLGLYNFFDTFRLIGSAFPIMLGQAVLAFPLVFITVSAGLRSIDPAVVRAASSLGASWLRIVTRVELPLLRWSIAGAAMFAAAFCFDELIVALFLSTPDARTLPVQIFSSAQEAVSPAIAAASTIVMIVAVATIGTASLLISGTRRARHRSRIGESA